MIGAWGFIRRGGFSVRRCFIRVYSTFDTSHFLNIIRPDMLYDTKSGSYRKFVSAGDCSVCFETFCTSCPQCLESRALFPCGCKTADTCNRCFITIVQGLGDEEYCDCGCGVLMMRCPTCRTVCNVPTGIVDWAKNTSV